MHELVVRQPAMLDTPMRLCHVAREVRNFICAYACEINHCSSDATALLNPNVKRFAFHCRILVQPSNNSIQRMRYAPR